MSQFQLLSQTSYRSNGGKFWSLSSNWDISYGTKTCGRCNWCILDQKSLKLFNTSISGLCETHCQQVPEFSRHFCDSRPFSAEIGAFDPYLASFWSKNVIYCQKRRRRWRAENYPHPNPTPSISLIYHAFILHLWALHEAMGAGVLRLSIKLRHFILKTCDGGNILCFGPNFGYVKKVLSPKHPNEGLLCLNNN